MGTGTAAIAIIPYFEFPSIFAQLFPHFPASGLTYFIR